MSGWLAACAERPASGPPVTGIAETIVPTTGSAGTPNLAGARDGTVYLTWIEQQPDSGHALQMASFRDGTLSQPSRIAAGRNWFVNWADFPMLAVADDGTLAAHFLQRSSAGRYSYDVRITTSRDGGRTWSAPVTPHRDGTAAEHGFVSLFSLGDRFGAVWLDGRKHAAAENGEGEMTVRFTTITLDGRAGQESEIDGRACDCCQTSVALTAKGPLLVYRDRSSGEIRDIAASRYSAGTWSEPVAVHVDNWHIAACPVNGPSVDARDNDVAVAWFTAAKDSPRVFVAFSNDAGSTFGTPVRIDDGTPLGRVDVQLVDAENALVSWVERVEGAAEIRVRRASAVGSSGPAALVSRTTAERPSGFPHMLVSGNKAYFAWTEHGKPARVHFATADVNR